MSLLQSLQPLLPCCVAVLPRLGQAALAASRTARCRGHNNQQIGQYAQHYATSSKPASAVSATQPLQEPQQQQGAQAAPQLDFNDYQSIFNMRSTGELLRMYLVLKACSITPLVRNAEALVRTSRRVLGDGFTFGLMRHTFMKQFCAGEKEQDLWPTINLLRANGIGTIIDYAAEDDVEAAAKPGSQGPAAAQQPSAAAATTDGSGSTAADAADSSAGAPVLGATQLPGAVAVGRTYSYEDEATCDKHVDIFLQAIATGAKLPGQGFAAIKVTALGNPMLLERMSAALLEIRSLFREADLDVGAANPRKHTHWPSTRCSQPAKPNAMTPRPTPVALHARPDHSSTHEQLQKALL